MLFKKKEKKKRHKLTAQSSRSWTSQSHALQNLADGLKHWPEGELQVLYEGTLFVATKSLMDKKDSIA